MCETALSPELAERLELHWKKANRQEFLAILMRPRGVGEGYFALAYW
jgi:hypothetical protein